MPKYIEYESEDDDEIEVIPYVKPAPPVIDLIDEESDKDKEEQEKSKKSSKEKKKKKKKNRDVAPNSVELVDSPEDFLCGDVVTIAVNVETESSLQAKKADRNVEQSAGVGSEASSSNSSSRNVVSQNRGSKSVTGPLNTDEVHADSSQPTVAQPDSVIAIIDSVVNVVNEVEHGSKVASTPEVGNADDTASSTSKSKRRSSAEPKRPRKMSQLTATKKTAAEISSFLNTLGIPIEVRDLTPVTRRRTAAKSPRGVRKSLDMVDVPATDATTTTTTSDSLSTSSLATVTDTTGNKSSDEIPKQPPNGFVQVTQEISSPRKKKSKKSKSNSKVNPETEVIEDDHTDTPVDLITNFVCPNGMTWPPPHNSINLDSDGTEISEIPSEPPPKKKKRKDRNSLDCNTENVDFIVENVSRDVENAEISSTIPEQPSVIQTGGSESTESAPISKKRKKNLDSGKEKDAEDLQKGKNRESKSNKKTSDANSDDTHLVVDKSIPIDENKDKSPCMSPKKKKSKTELYTTFIAGLVTTEKSKKSTDETDGDTSPTKQKEKNNRKQKNEKRKETREQMDRQNMPPPPNRADNFIVNVSSSPSRTVQRRSPEYYLNHPGFPAAWTDEMKTYYGAFRGKDYNDKDVYKRQSNSRSLWRTPADNIFQRRRIHGVRCSICHQFDHTNRNCPDKHKPLCCFMCGGKGHKYESGGRTRCPETCCLNCGVPREKFSSGCSQCLYKKSQPRCQLCGISGHNQDICPDNWRRYHSITNPLPDGAEELVTTISTTQYKRSHELYCCNCASRGHNYYDCNAPRYRNNPFHRNKPHIVREVDINSIIAHFGHPTTPPLNPPAISAGEQGQIQTPSPNRTVVVNLDVNEEEEVIEEREVISIKFQNDPVHLKGNEKSQREEKLPDVGSSSSQIENLEECSEHPDCSNKTTREQRCHHIAVNNYQQSLLLKAKAADAFRPIEERYKVNISILRQVLQVHISGENWKMAENELYEILFTRAKEEQIARDNVKAKSSSEEETTRKVVNDGENISVVISKPLFLNKTFAPVMPAVAPLPLVPSMDVDERFASPQDLITNIPIMRPDGPFAPGQYVPYSLSVVPSPSGYISPPLACSPAVSSHVQNVAETRDSQNSKSKSISTSTEKPPSTPTSLSNTQMLNATACKETSKSKTEVPSKSNVIIKPEEITVETIEDSDDEIIILEEIKEPPKKIQVVLEKTSPQKREPGLNVVLLPSEWDVVFADSIKKDGILQKIAKLFEVTIFVSKEDCTCTISCGSSFDRQKAKEKVTLWLGCHAAKTKFILNVPEESPSPTKDISTPSPQQQLTPIKDSRVAERISRRGMSPSLKRRPLGSIRAKGSLNSRRGGSPTHRYNPAPNTNTPGRSSSGHHNFGSGHKPRIHGGFLRGLPKSRGTATGTTSNKPQTESSKRRFRYFN